MYLSLFPESEVCSCGESRFLYHAPSKGMLKYIKATIKWLYMTSLFLRSMHLSVLKSFFVWSYRPIQNAPYPKHFISFLKLLFIFMIVYSVFFENIIQKSVIFFKSPIYLFTNMKMLDRLTPNNYFLKDDICFKIYYNANINVRLTAKKIITRTVSMPMWYNINQRLFFWHAIYELTLNRKFMNR